ncbi:hypothetical protein S40293_03767 [Stachybotrys chartarum IBT 40293]|nr:hypothetical protein S40293_03767 [Stachybotrys chartarum IBT 40293]
MKTVAALTLAASMANMVAGHAIFQQLWVNGVDQSSTCVRMPASNSPVEDPTSNNMRCNANPGVATTTCGVQAGDTVTVEMHQHNDRDCSKEAIGGAHHGPVMIYLGAVDDAATADGSGEFFKIYEAGYFEANQTWANDLINEGCGLQSFTIPSDIAPGDYLLRAETVALHAAGSPNGAQYYMSCYQLRIEGSGTATPAGVTFPGAYDATDPGLLINIYQTITNYIIPGPAVYSSGAAAPAPAPAPPAATSTAAPIEAPTTLVTSTAAPVTTSVAAVTTSAAAVTTAPVPVPTEEPVTPPGTCSRRRRARKARKARRSLRN